MRYMILLQGTNPPTPPPAELMEAIMKLGEEATKAGALLDTAGLMPSAAGARVSLYGGKVSITDGPFTEAKEWIGGFWVLEAPDLDAALKLAIEASAACEGRVEVRPFQSE